MHAAVLMSAHPLHDNSHAQLLLYMRLLPLLPHIRGHCTALVCALPSATAPPPQQRLPTALPLEPIIVDHPFFPSSSPGTPCAYIRPQPTTNHCSSLCPLPPDHPAPLHLWSSRHLIVERNAWFNPHTCLTAATTAARRFTCSFVQPLQSPLHPYAPHTPVSLLPSQQPGAPQAAVCSLRAAQAQAAAHPAHYEAAPPAAAHAGRPWKQEASHHLLWCMPAGCHKHMQQLMLLLRRVLGVQTGLRGYCRCAAGG